MKRYNVYVGFNGVLTPWVSQMMVRFQKLFDSQGIEALCFAPAPRVSFCRSFRVELPRDPSVLAVTMNGDSIIESCILVIPPDDRGPYYGLAAQAAIAFLKGIPVTVCTSDQSKSEDLALSSFIRANGGTWAAFLNPDQMIDQLCKGINRRHERVFSL